MKRNHIICLLLAAAMLLSLTACGSAAAAAPAQATAAPQQTEATAEAQPTAAPATAAPEETVEELPLSDVDVQLALFYSQIDSLIQKAGELPWFYSVTDLDHDGNLEFIAASQHPQDRSTNLKIWTVDANRSALSECVVVKDPEESFPDIMTDTTDTYHDVAADTWYYMFYDNVLISPTDVYTSKSAFNLKNGAISYEAFAVEHSVVQNGNRVVSHTDANGNSILPATYNAAGEMRYAGAERSNTHFEWLTAEEARDLGRLTDSIAVFDGRKVPTENFPVPRPAALSQPGVSPSPTPTATPSASPTATPVPTPTPTAAPVYLTITKNPTNEENRVIGGTASFVACANAYESLAWTVVDPLGNTYTPQQLAEMFGTTVSGVYSSTLTITVTQNMNNFGFYCTFYYKNQTARTSTAYIHIKDAPAPEPVPAGGGEAEGYVMAWNYGYVSLRLSGGISANATWDVVDLEGDIYEGARCFARWTTTSDGNQITYCRIAGLEPEPEPEYASMSGTVYRDTASTVYVVLNDGTALHIDGLLVNLVEGSEINNARCVAYYTGTPTESSVYQLDVFGYDPEPEYVPDPEPSVSYYSIRGTAYHDTARTMRVELENGTKLTINVVGTEVNILGGSEIEGAPCVVYYTDALTEDSVYKVDIYGYDPAPEPVIETVVEAAPVLAAAPAPETPAEPAAESEPVTESEPETAPGSENEQQA